MLQLRNGYKHMSLRSLGSSATITRIETKGEQGGVFEKDGPALAC